nr:DUF423 domain-containing protein [Roseospira goensis]
MWIVVGALFGLLAVALGAFAAHILEARGAARAVDLVETAARYQATHALALVLCGLLGLIAGAGAPAARWAGRAGLFFTLGIVLFCGALYGIALLGWPLGMVAPLGGTSFMVGWGLLAVAGWRASRPA